MKKIQMAGLVMLLLSMTFKLAAQNNTTEQMVVALTNPGKSYSLHIGLTFGSIRCSC